MKFKALALVLAILAQTGVPVTAADPITIRQHVIYYDVTGSTLDELADSIDVEGPRSLGPFIAVTDFAYSWEIEAVRNHDAAGMPICRLTGTIVLIKITTTLPRYADIGTAPRSVRGFWKRFIAALTKHEDNHAKDFIAIGSKIPAALDGITAPNCIAAKLLANSRGQEFVDEARQSAVDYDARTNHGVNEGAGFPRF
jgi:predicted secreted Zn-dependent protease